MSAENDFITSVEKALDETDSEWANYSGLIIGGSHRPTGVENKIKRIEYARLNGLPFLGICLGFQLMCIEFARHELLLKNANSTEIDPETAEPVIIKMPHLRVGIKPVAWQGKTKMESHWHNYRFNNGYLPKFKPWFSVSKTGYIVEIMKLNQHPFFMGVQFHPEYQSTPDKPHPIIKEFLNICRLQEI